MNAVSKPWILRLLSTIFFYSICSVSYAAGLGFTFGQGSEEWDDDEGDVNFLNDERDISNYGFVFDTALARKSLFNYRLSLSQEKNKAAENGADFSGYSMTHDFGFAMLRTAQVRLWMGPRLRVTIYDKDLGSGEDLVFEEDDVQGFGFGPVLGVNANLPAVVTLSFSAAYLSGSYDHGGDSFIFSDDEVTKTGYYLNFSIIFRLNDHYSHRHRR